MLPLINIFLGSCLDWPKLSPFEDSRGGGIKGACDYASGRDFFSQHQAKWSGSRIGFLKAKRWKYGGEREKCIWNFGGSAANQKETMYFDAGFFYKGLPLFEQALFKWALKKTNRKTFLYRFRVRVRYAGRRVSKTRNKSQRWDIFTCLGEVQRGIFFDVARNTAPDLPTQYSLINRGKFTRNSFDAPAFIREFDGIFPPFSLGLSESGTFANRNDYVIEHITRLALEVADISCHGEDEHSCGFFDVPDSPLRYAIYFVYAMPVFTRFFFGFWNSQ